MERNKVSRLDTVTEDYVGHSTQESKENQILRILQNISETTAMIYDALFGSMSLESEKEEAVPHGETVEKTDENVPARVYTIAEVLESEKGKRMVFEKKGFAMPYYVDYMGATFGSIDLDVYGFPMQCQEISCGKDWRLWDYMPTEQQRRETPWNV